MCSSAAAESEEETYVLSLPRSRYKDVDSGNWFQLAALHSWLQDVLTRAEKPSLATAMSVWKERDSRPEDDWISGGIFVPQPSHTSSQSYLQSPSPTSKGSFSRSKVRKVSVTSMWGGAMIM
ncbi:hypothetical protein EYF80_032230 [Liparis tanakae]|uniref:Uncharacterized protein n=1 Tax=Liparis tanakae TaxID=230148 RepID=A0A4Z2GY82_9TELE|nr:hypothetical protein EYF80_032230 [Liparis tanakae]